MKLPNADKAIIDREKIADYLLNPAHPDNGGKAPLVQTVWIVDKGGEAARLVTAYPRKA
jgi:hypothetical protein